MPLADPSDIPSLDHVFGHNRPLMKAFEQAYITSVVPVMLLPKQVLMEFHGIGERTATYITGALAQNGRGHHRFDEKIVDFVDEQFGNVEAAPVSILNVVTLRHQIGPRQYYRPLELLKLIDEVNPQYTIGQLMQATTHELLEMLEHRVHFGPMLEALMVDLKDVNWRLYWWEEAMKVGSLRSSPQRNGLRLVGSR